MTRGLWETRGSVLFEPEICSCHKGTRQEITGVGRTLRHCRRLHDRDIIAYSPIRKKLRVLGVLRQRYVRCVFDDMSQELLGSGYAWSPGESDINFDFQSTSQHLAVSFVFIIAI